MAKARRVTAGLATAAPPGALAAAELTRLLGLTHPPVGIAFRCDPPEGVAIRVDVAASACALWRPAERDSFFAPADTQLGCAVGAMVLGVPLDDDARARLAATVGYMTGNGYLGSAEPAALPTRQQRTGGIWYGPLASLPVIPDLVLTWLSPRAAMLLGEAAQAMSWTGSRGLTLTGRPGCAALPLAEQSGSVSASLGCTGMRRFTGIEDDLLLAVVPGPQVDSYVSALCAATVADTTMDSFYAAAAQNAPGPRQPTAVSPTERGEHP